MSHTHNPVPEDPTPRRPWQRWQYRTVAAVGLVTVLGTSLLAAEHAGQRRADTGADMRLNMPSAGSASAGSASAGSAPAGSAPAGTGSPSQSASASRSAPAAANAAAAPGRRPSAHAAAQADTVPVTITNTGSLPADHHTMRVVSAHGDLTGQRELAWAADSGHAVGTARCTQNFRFNPQAPAGVRPTMLMCWRTSATRSVYVILVDLDHKPSESTAVSAINQAWAKL